MSDINSQEFMGSSGPKPTSMKRGRLQVSRVGPSFNWQAFQTHLESYGQIIKTTSQTDDDDQSLLTCFVEFNNSESARRAADDLNGIDFDGSRLELIYTEDHEDTDTEGYDDTPKQRNRPGIRGRQRYNRPNNHTNMPLRILIPGDMVGAIIGRGGETVRKMSNNTNARIDVHRRANINGFKPVTITGQTENPEENCSAAFREIHQKLIEETEKKNEGEEPKCVPMRLLAPDLLMGRVIGKGGRNLKDIKIKTNTRIDVTRDPVTLVYNERIITIEDPSNENPVEKCCRAEEEISKILRKSYQDDLNNMANMNTRMPQNPGGPPIPANLMGFLASLMGQRNMLNMPQQGMIPGMNPSSFMGLPGMYVPAYNSAKVEKLFVAVPKELVGAIIGREGSVVNSIRHNTGASVQVLKSDDESPDTLVELRGQPYQTSMALGDLFDKVQAQGYSSRKGQEQPYGNGSLKLRTEIKVPANAVGRLIGRRGTKVRSIQQRNSAMVDVPRDISPEEEEVVVRIYADYYGSLGAQGEIREIVAQFEAQQGK